MSILTVIAAILLFGIFSGLEIVFTSGRILNYKTANHQKDILKIAERYTRESAVLWISCLMVKLLSLGVVTFYIYEQSAKAGSHSSDWLFSTGIVMLVTGLILLLFLLEFLPKSLSHLYAEKIIPSVSSIILLTIRILYYPSRILKNLSSFFLKIAKVPEENTRIEYAALDLEKLIQEHQTFTDEAEIQVDTELVENVLLLKNIKVRECMVPRNEIIAVEISDSIDKLKDTIIETNHSRILIYEDSIDNIIGYIHHFDLHKHPSNIEKILLPIEIVPEAMPLQVLLNKLVSQNKSLAWVVNEYGGTAGIVTLEDVLEEIFGEIEDEYDDNEYVENQLSKNEFILSGRLEIDRINEEYELSIPEGDYETLSGLIVSHTGNIPKENEVIQIEKYSFKILSVSETKVETIKLTVEDLSNKVQ